MTWITVAECNVCKTEKKGSNHWFELHVDQSGELMIGPMSGASSSPSIEHICGQACLHRRLDQWLAEAAQPITTLTEGADHHGSYTQQS